jgi:hypothetical protein
MYVEFDIEWNSDGIKVHDKTKVKFICFITHKNLKFYIIGNLTILF